ncbi:hypothetical protein L3H50_10075 [Corynebacterium sp. MC-04]|uniref:Secreted protein n=1 Tax=Corynebacterium parakroppenstedtii TaxID=2828363 RepID=A0ABS9HIQ9_9CORY|nr:MULTISPECIES: hypothetical protein [Corynebacterium]KXB50970.1 hypothetical protein HMPREF1861_00749 [Corynebacterium kroppenstedtii]MBY0792436.1 hypothetical protein [Corynebacterium parakroppenstedtii]MBY0795808.1 hypothetical protein [Corynebacterium parakroppenstedtii]MCF6769387.1 hypothetical protein [Corynebacterium parakroppenstedtii]MCF6770753.1 hypothetical protein [Corynebacterium parakroppenstedtii]
MVELSAGFSAGLKKTRRNISQREHGDEMMYVKKFSSRQRGAVASLFVTVAAATMLAGCSSSSDSPHTENAESAIPATSAGQSSSEVSHSDSSSTAPPNSTHSSTEHFVNSDGTCNPDVIDINHEKNTAETHYHGLPDDQVAMKFYDINGNNMEDVGSGFSAGKTGEGPLFATGVANADISYIGVKIEHKNGESQECKILVD